MNEENILRINYILNQLSSFRDLWRNYEKIDKINKIDRMGEVFEDAHNLIELAWGDNENPGLMRCADVCERINMAIPERLFDAGFALSIKHEPVTGYIGIEFVEHLLWDNQDNDERKYINEEIGKRELFEDYILKCLSEMKKNFIEILDGAKGLKETDD